MAEQLQDRNAPPKKRRIGRILVLLLVVVILASAGYYVWRYLNTFESTDDAQIDGHIHAVSGRINGNVVEIRAEDAQVVKAGDVLVRIDPRDYEAAVAKAEQNNREIAQHHENQRRGDRILESLVENGAPECLLSVRRTSNRPIAIPS